LIRLGAKRVENRTWSTGYRGLIYIHAGKSLDWLTLNFEKTIDVAYGIPIDQMTFGAVVAIATLTDCVHIDRVGQPHIAAKYPWLERHKHTEGPWCWVLDNVTPIGPCPWKGEPGLFEIDEEALRRVANDAH
jgi:hypothetical protein